MPLAIHRTAGVIVHASMCTFILIHPHYLTRKRQSILMSRFVMIVFVLLKISHASKKEPWVISYSSCQGMRPCRTLLYIWQHGKHFIPSSKHPLGSSSFRYSGIYPVIRKLFRITSNKTNVLIHPANTMYVLPTAEGQSAFPQCLQVLGCQITWKDPINAVYLSRCWSVCEIRLPLTLLFVS